MTPQLHFTVYDLKPFIGKAFPALRVEMDIIAKRVKFASGSKYDNVQFYIDDEQQNPALQILFFNDRWMFWNAKTSKSVYLDSDEPEPKVFNDAMKKAIGQAVGYVRNGYYQCTVCGKWESNSNYMMDYDFSGSACQRCYNPTIHRPPRTI